MDRATTRDGGRKLIGGFEFEGWTRHMTYKDCCDRLGEKLSESGPLVGAEALVLLEECVDALRENSAGGKLDEAALIEHFPKLRTAIRTVWNHDKALAVSLENRIIAIIDAERSRSKEAEDRSSDDAA